ncbi:hypothetical protein [Paraburkholderia sp. BCC1876]|uniref:hypothetical protein n=1 Tax=Paraburkholderia sp. BCC1876 TaxID=2676303 RepID=UPI00158FA79D|nr:hypothetical protein [Paraburkholderia sp. BCC1876]
MKGKKWFLVFVWLLGALFFLPVERCAAMDVSACDATLAKDAYNDSSTSSTDYRLATLVTQSDWEQASHSGGASAVIYGFPVGASYSDYKNSVTESLNARNESLTDNETRQLAMQYLSDNSLTAYLACIRGVTRTPGVGLYLGKVTDTTMSVHATYAAPGTGFLHLPVRVKWSGMVPSPGTSLPHYLNPGDDVILEFSRPKASAIVSIRAGGTADDIILSALIPPPESAPNYILKIDEIDDRFTCYINENRSVIYQVGFGQSNSWNINSQLHPGENSLNCKEEDLHPDNHGNPCWHYHVAVFKDGKSFIEHDTGSCGAGAQPPGPVAQEMIPF